MGKLKSVEELFKGRHFDREVVILCVRWYLRFELSLRDLVEMMAERGLWVRLPSGNGLTGSARLGWERYRWSMRVLWPDGTGVPLDWPGATYAMATQRWAGPHYSAAIAGVARPGSTR
jgi:hypothetical protein